MTKNNLVFGLSATAEISRYVKNFDLDWLHNELGKQYYEISDSDTSLIQKAKESKFNARKNQIQIQIAETNISDNISQLINSFVHTHQQDFETGKRQEFRRERLIRFFVTLQWVTDNYQKKK